MVLNSIGEVAVDVFAVLCGSHLSSWDLSVGWKSSTRCSSFYGRHWVVWEHILHDHRNILEGQPPLCPLPADRRGADPGSESSPSLGSSSGSPSIPMSSVATSWTSSSPSASWSASPAAHLDSSSSSFSRAWIFSTFGDELSLLHQWSQLCILWSSPGRRSSAYLLQVPSNRFSDLCCFFPGQSASSTIWAPRS